MQQPIQVTRTQRRVSHTTMSQFPPASFEHVAIYNFVPPTEWTWFTQWRWTIFAWIATDFYAGYRNMSAEVRRKI